VESEVSMDNRKKRRRREGCLIHGDAHEGEDDLFKVWC
jgi:hypothetical protein